MPIDNTASAGGAMLQNQQQPAQQQAQWSPQQQPIPPASSGGTGVGGGGLFNPQGSGIVPQDQSAAAAGGGFQTGGWQYNTGASGPIQGSIMDNSGQFSTQTIDPTQMPVSSVQGGNYYDQQSADAYYNQATSRLDPQWQQRQDQQATMLANMGITPGSDAWNRQMTAFNQGRNDAYNSAQNQAFMNAGADAARMQGMDISAGNFANQAAQANFQNQIASQQARNAALTGQQAASAQAGNFANQAQQQGFNQQLANAQLNNAAVGGQQQLASQWDIAQKQAQSAANAAQAQMAMAQMQASSNRDIAQMGAANQARQIQDAERQQDFQNAMTMQAWPLELQNMAMQGMNIPTGMPQFTSFQTPGMGSPTPYMGPAQGAEQGLTSALGSFGGDFLKQLGGFFGQGGSTSGGAAP